MQRPGQSYLDFKRYKAPGNRLLKIRVSMTGHLGNRRSGSELGTGQAEGTFSGTTRLAYSLRLLAETEPSVEGSAEGSCWELLLSL